MDGAIPRTRFFQRCASSGSASSRTVRSAAAFSRAAFGGSRICLTTTIGATLDAFKARTLRRTWTSCATSNSWRGGKDARRRSAKRRVYLEENVGALEVSLSAADLSQIDAIAPRDVAAGLRYPEAGMRSVNR